MISGDSKPSCRFLHGSRLNAIISYFNWIWVHSRLGTTAAQRADLTSEPWTWRDIAVYPTLC